MDLSKIAFKKSVLHSLKHGSSDCIGVLISNDTHISDAIPLFHESVVGPSLDSAFKMLQDFYLTPNPSYKIVGVYASTVSIGDEKFLPSTYRILESIKDFNHENPLILKIFNKENEDKTEAQLEITMHKYTGDNKTSKIDDFE